MGNFDRNMRKTYVKGFSRSLHTNAVLSADIVGSTKSRNPSHGEIQANIATASEIRAYMLSAAMQEAGMSERSAGRLAESDIAKAETITQMHQETGMAGPLLEALFYPQGVFLQNKYRTFLSEMYKHFSSETQYYFQYVTQGAVTQVDGHVNKNKILKQERKAVDGHRRRS